MKNVLVLHGTDSTPQDNWFSWLKEELEKKGFLVWVPQLPHSEKPNIKRYTDFLLANKDWQFNAESIIVGHSSGAVEILGLLQKLPYDTVVDTCILVGAFHNDLGWVSLKELFIEPFDFPKIKTHAKHFIFIHSDDDPYCPLEQATYLAEKLDGKLIIKKGQKHFSVSTGTQEFVKFPFLLELINQHTQLYSYQTGD